MKKDKKQISNRSLVLTVAALGVIVISLIVLLILEANGVFYKESENGDIITPPKKANNETLLDGDYYYVLLTDGTVMITAYMGQGEEDIVVPSTLGEYRVSAIGEAAYGGLTVSYAKTVTLPEGITFIGKKQQKNIFNSIDFIPIM